MKGAWIRDIILDLLVTLAIVIALFLDFLWLAYAIYVYTILILITRLLLLRSSGLRTVSSKQHSSAPKWIYHLLYATNVVLLALHLWLLTAAAWAVIWALAAYEQQLAHS